MGSGSRVRSSVSIILAGIFSKLFFPLIILNHVLNMMLDFLCLNKKKKIETNS